MNAEQFAAFTGTPPEQDDLDRCNCKAAGLPGHEFCGWCGLHRMPMFMCRPSCQEFRTPAPAEHAPAISHEAP